MTLEEAVKYGQLFAQGAGGRNGDLKDLENYLKEEKADERATHAALEAYRVFSRKDESRAEWKAKQLKNLGRDKPPSWTEDAKKLANERKDATPSLDDLSEQVNILGKAAKDLAARVDTKNIWEEGYRAGKRGGITPNPYSGVEAREEYEKGRKAGQKDKTSSRDDAASNLGRKDGAGDEKLIKDYGIANGKYGNGRRVKIIVAEEYGGGKSYAMVLGDQYYWKGSEAEARKLAESWFK